MYGIKEIRLALPEGLHEKFKKRAQEDNQTMKKALITLIEEYAIFGNDLFKGKEV